MAEAASLMASPPVPDRRRRWWRRRFVVPALLVLIPLAGYAMMAAVLYVIAERQYWAAASEADRLDPGWRFAEVMARRARVPDAENSARRILAADAKGGGKEPPASLDEAVGFWGFVADGPLEGERLAALRDAMKSMGPALEEALAVAEMPRGRYEATWSGDMYSGRLADVQAARRVARWLRLDAALRSHDGDIEGALRCARAILNVGRSMGDEPALVSQVARFSFDTMAVYCVEEALARGEASGATLARVQAELAREARESLVLATLRGERGVEDELTKRFRTGEADPIAALELERSPLVRWYCQGRNLRENQARVLGRLNRMVELAKLPDDRQFAGLRQLESRWNNEWDTAGILDRLRWTPAKQSISVTMSVAMGQIRTRVLLDVATVGAAAERYRLAQGRWPDSPDRLVPEYLEAVPIDPYLGTPLRQLRNPGEFAIYSVGPDGQDDAGHRSPATPFSNGNDIVFRLWEPARRGPSGPVRPAGSERPGEASQPGQPRGGS
jgi:hypothetical protein